MDRPRPNVRMDPHEHALRGESEPPESLSAWLRREHPATLWLLGVCALGGLVLTIQAGLAIWRVVFAWWR